MQTIPKTAVHENDSVDGDRFNCECAFLYLPGLVWTGPKYLLRV